MVRVFANGPGFNPMSIHTKYSKNGYLMLPCPILSNIRYVSRVKWGKPGKGLAPSSTPWWSSYGKGSLWVTLDKGSRLYFTYCYGQGGVEMITRLGNE